MIKPRIKKFKNRFRLIIYNDTTFDEVYSIKLSPINLYIFISIGLFLTLFFIFLTISTFTPLKNFIIGYQQNIHEKLAQSAIKVELLEDQVAKQSLYINNLKKIINGEHSTTHTSTIFSNSENDILKKYVETNLNQLQYSSKKELKLENLILYPPVQGLIIDSMYIHTSHFGVDIVTKKNAVVSAVLDGTIIFADWTTHSGYVIHIQHRDNIISVYKHNSEFLKTVGNRIYAGDIIAIVGNTGETSTGPHLHFELWHNGYPLNPKDIILF